MIIITSEERKKLWEQYPEIRELFEEYNRTILEDESAWERLSDKCHKIRDDYYNSSVIEMLLCDAVRELEKLAKKRRYG